MAFENELKYVLTLDDKIEHKAKDYGSLYVIEQRYLAKKDFTLRIRKSIDVKIGVTNRYMTFKQDVNHKCIEIEKKLDQSEEESFELLWNNCNSYTVRKHRYCYDHEDDKWVFDFFKNKENKTYFVKAEVELVDNKNEPSFLPAIVVDNLVYKVCQEDSRFSNKKLGNEEYALQLYKQCCKALKV